MASRGGRRARAGNRLTSETFIEIDHVTFGYDASRPILNDLSLKFQRGKVTAILGGSGCGKTTLMRLVGGVHATDKGRVVFDGEVVDTRDQAAAVPAAPAPGHAVPVRRAVHRPHRLRERGLSAARAHHAARGHDPRHRADEAQCRGPAWRGRAAHQRGLGRHGAPHRAGARDRARPRAHHLRRALRRPGPDLAWAWPPSSSARSTTSPAPPRWSSRTTCPSAWRSATTSSCWPPAAASWRRARRPS